MIKIESLGSFWFIDTQKETYTRTPKREKPREAPFDGGGTMLQDLQTFSYTRLEFIELEGDNFWATVYKQPIVAVLRFHYRGPVRNSPLGRGCWLHAPLTNEQYQLAKEQLYGKVPVKEL